MLLYFLFKNDLKDGDKQVSLYPVNLLLDPANTCGDIIDYGYYGDGAQSMVLEMRYHCRYT